jgi:hypothetical protein
MPENDDLSPDAEKTPMPEAARSPTESTPPGAPRDDREGEREKKRLFERAIPELVKGFVERAVERGVERLTEGPENLRQFVGDLKLPKEVLHYLYTQMDDTKNGLYRVVAKEIRDVLEQTHFADEITKVLTKLSFEIKTEIRFIPNDAARPSDRERSEDDDDDDEPESGKSLPRPEVTAQVSMKDRSREPRRERRRREGT